MSDMSDKERKRAKDEQDMAEFKRLFSNPHGHSDGEDAWWENRNLAGKVLIVIGFIILGIGLLFLFGFVVMLLWNWLMPEIFGLKQITYWQAWGLLALSSILFKGFGSGESSGRRSEKKRKRHLRKFMDEDMCREGDPAVDSQDSGSGEDAKQE